MNNSLEILLLPVELLLSLLKFNLFGLELIMKFGIGFERVKLEDIFFIIIEIYALFCEWPLILIVLLYLF